MHPPLAKTEKQALAIVETRAIAHIKRGEPYGEILDPEAGKQVWIGVDSRAARGPTRIKCWAEILPGVRSADRFSSSFDVRVNTEQALTRILSEKSRRLDRLRCYDCRLLVITKSYGRAQLAQVKEIPGALLGGDPSLAAGWDAVLFLFPEDERRLYLGEDDDAPVDERRIAHRRGDLHVLATPTGWRFPQPESLSGGVNL